MKTSFPSDSAEQYEALRQNAVARERIFSASPLGAILVVKAGVAGWMLQWKQVSGEVVIAAPSSPPPRSPPPSQPGWQHELTMLLAPMSARHLRPALPS